MTDSILKKPESEAPSFEGLYTNTPTDFGINTSSSIDWNQTINKEDSINRFYVADNDVPYVDEEESTKDKVVKNVAGLGVEIGTGIGTDYATAPLLLAGPKGWAAYAVINFASGYSSNIAAQKIRGETKISYGEGIANGFFQMIPYGSTGKGVKGLAGAGLQGATTAAGEHTIRTRIDENRWPTSEEYAVSGTIGTIFGAGFKGTVDGLSGIYKKYNGKSAAEIDKLVTKKEKKIIDEILIDTRGKGEFYHGTAKKIPDGRVTSVESGENISDGNLLGNGFYTTDDLTTAAKYRKKGKKQVLKPDIPLGGPGVIRRSDLPYGITDYLRKTNITSEEASQLLNPGIEVPPPDRLRDLAKQLRQFPIDNPYSGGARTRVDRFTELADRLDELATNPPKAKKFEPEIYKLTEKQPVKFFDADKRIPWTDTSSESKVIREGLEGREYFETLEFWERNKTTSYADLISELKDEIARLDRPISEATEVIDDLNYELGKLGYGGLTHQGGVRAGKGKRLHQVKIYWDAENQLNVNKADIGGGEAGVTKLPSAATDPATRKSQFEGPPPPKTPPGVSQGKGPLKGTDTTPHQINPDQVTSAVDTKEIKHRQRNFNFIVKRIKQLKDEGAFSQVKTTADTIDGGIKMLADTNKLKEHAQMYAKIYGLVPTDELNYALAEAVTLATKNSAEVNQRLINAINVSKDPISIEQNINELIKSIGEIDDWLRLGIPLRTEQGRGLRSMQIPTQGVTPAEFAKMTPAEKYKLKNVDQSSIGISSSEQGSRLEDLQGKLLSAFEEAKQTGDYSKLNKLTNTIKRADGNVEKISALYETGLLHKTLSTFNKANRIFNEIGINALLSAPTTNEVNFISGVLETYMGSWELIRGAGSRTELDAAIRHLIALHSNASFARKAFTESFKMSDNWINRGAVKADYQEKFVISSDGKDIISRAVINPGGKVIRFPSQLMTSVDALIQAPNLIASVHYQAHIEGSKIIDEATGQFLKGKVLDNYIKGHLDAILEYYASNSGKGIKDPITAKILKRSQEFAKRSTFTEDIRDDGYFYFGKAAKGVNNLAGQIPLVRTLLSFIRTPTNIIKRQLRRTPVLNKALREVANDLESTDPIVRNQARGQLKVSQDLGLTVAALTGAGLLMQQDPNFVPPVILTGGGPDWSTKEGRAVWKNMLKNGWQPYSVGYLQKNEDGSPLLGDDGKPTYKYYSYERLDPLSTWIGLMVDFVVVSGVLTDDEYDEFTTGWAGAFSRNLFDRSYLSQIDDAMKALTDDKGGAERENFWARQLASRFFYGNFTRYSKQLPGDLLGMAGVSEKDSAKYKQKRDTKVRKGDKLFDTFPVSGDKEITGARALRKLLNQYSATVPGMGGNLPLLREHITNDPILHPQKPGPDLFSWVKTSTSKGHPIFTALATIGKELREPSDIVDGDLGGEIESFRLNTQQYAELRSIVNTIKPNNSGGRTLDQALRAYLKTDHYNNNLAIVKKRGALNADIAVKQIYSKLQEINNYYIGEGEKEWMRKQGRARIKTQRQKELTIQQEYINDLQSFSAD